MDAASSAMQRRGRVFAGSVNDCIGAAMIIAMEQAGIITGPGQDRGDFAKDFDQARASFVVPWGKILLT